jgi:triacylglycerol lipase
VSTLVELSPELYSAEAFAAFDPAANFSIGNARALMWFSQLAYEADTTPNPTIAAVSRLWGFTSVTPFVKQKVAVTASFETTGLVGERPDAVVLAFAGTDPAVWQSLVTDANVRLTRDNDTHIGFQTALDGASSEIKQAVALSRQNKKPLFVTGHSLGAALAALAAKFADELPDGRAPQAVYVYGMPRAGGERFRDAYNTRLGPITYRFVHGEDIVARVPMSELRIGGIDLGYRHVGRMLACASGGRFNAAAISATVTDDPQFAQGLVDTFVGGVAGALAGHLFSPLGPGTFGPLFKFLPQPIRDHLQDQYYEALAA